MQAGRVDAGCAVAASLADRGQDFGGHPFGKLPGLRLAATQDQSV